MPAHGQGAPAETSGAPQTLPGGDEATAPAAPVEFKPGILGKTVQSGVTTNDLGIVDGAPVGTLDDSSDGLGQSMWASSPRGEIEDLLGAIPLVSADPFARTLARRVVLTTSDSPVGPAKRALVTIRIEKLLQAGMIAEAGAIAAQLQLSGDADFARVQADAFLYAGRDNEVCSPSTATRLTSDEPFWLQLRTWCFAVAGDTASAELTRAVLDAQGGADEALDTLMADALTGKTAPPRESVHPTALHIYLLRKIGLAVTNATAAKLGTAANTLAARDSRNAPADRLAAATRISQTGALAPAEMVAIMNAQSIPADQLTRAPELAAGLAFLPAQSLLRRAATLESRPPAKAALLAVALSADGHRDRLIQTALLNADIAVSLPPSPAIVVERDLIARALILSGRSDAAAAWLGATDKTASQALQVLLDIASPASANAAATQAALTGLATGAAPPQSPSPLSALALGLSDVLGRPMPPNAKSLAASLEGTRWEGLSRRPSDDAVRNLEDAASQPGRRGEVALRVLDIVGANGPSDLPADVTIECVRVLQQVGLGDDARRLAIEALAMAAS